MLKSPQMVITCQDLYAFNCTSNVMSRKVQKKKNDQYVITIPKSIAESRDWSQGTELKFKTITRGKHAGKIRLQEADKK